METIVSVHNDRSITKIVGAALFSSETLTPISPPQRKFVDPNVAVPFRVRRVPAGISKVQLFIEGSFPVQFNIYRTVLMSQLETKADRIANSIAKIVNNTRSDVSVVAQYDGVRGAGSADIPSKKSHIFDRRPEHPSTFNYVRFVVTRRFPYAVCEFRVSSPSYKIVYLKSECPVLDTI